ncbi:MAG TPA: ABC transporter substrate-binding protein [Candidatus Acidoferrum sp.]|nr:ABC transporter substrate-binding protein [Candidatus Acidoferrum sp.]
MRVPRSSRRAFLRAALSGAAVAVAPSSPSAQTRSVKIGIVHPVTGLLTEPGQACRLGAKMASEAINAAGGIKGLGGVRFELLFGDSQGKADVARAEAERVIGQGAQMLLGAFDSAGTAAMVPVVQQRRVPFLVDLATADSITANVAKAVRDGAQKVQYVYRNFPTASSFGRKAVQYFSDIFKEAGVSPKRVVLMHCNDPFGQGQARGFVAAHKAANPAWEIVETIPWPEPPVDLSTEVSRAKAARPDVIAPITRPGSAQILLTEIRRQRVELMGVVSPGSPGLYEAAQVAALKDDLEHVLTSVPWPNFKNPKTAAVAEEYRKRTGGKTFDTNAGYAYDAVLVAADVLERARSTDGEAIVEALRKTHLIGGLMQYGGLIAFNEGGDNPNAIPTLIQILGGKPVAVWPREAALQKLVFPRPRG